MIPTRIGQKYAGGYFAGLNRINRHVYAVIAAPKDAMHYLPVYDARNAIKVDSFSQNDGLSNTRAMNNSSPCFFAANYCCELTYNGYTDWYLPSIHELELCYRYLKPFSANNITFHATDYDKYRTFTQRVNPNSIPVGCEYTKHTPAQTTVIDCRSRLASFSTDTYISSTHLESKRLDHSYGFDLNGGVISYFYNRSNWIVYPVRREQLV